MWLGASRGIDGNDISWLVAFVVAGAGLLMVSSVRYHSFKEFHIGRVPFKVLLGVIVAFAIVFLDPPLVLLAVAVVYVVAGLLLSLWGCERAPPRRSRERAPRAPFLCLAGTGAMVPVPRQVVENSAFPALKSAYFGVKDQKVTV